MGALCGSWSWTRTVLVLFLTAARAPCTEGARAVFSTRPGGHVESWPPGLPAVAVPLGLLDTGERSSVPVASLARLGGHGGRWQPGLHAVAVRLGLLDTGERSSAPVPESMPVVRHEKQPASHHPAPLTSAQAQSREEEEHRAANESAVPPVSTTLRCVTLLITFFFFFYSVLFVLQTINRLGAAEMKREERGWASVVESVFFVPMLCVLFLAARLQAMQLSFGRPEEFGLPQLWVKFAMVVCTVAVLLAATMQVCVVFVNKVPEVDGQVPSWVLTLSTIIRALKKVALSLIYACFTFVCIGACSMGVPEELGARGLTARPSAAVSCTVFLTVMYFALYLALVCVSLGNEFGLMGQRLRFCQSLECIKAATAAVVLSPMVCALFLACQVRALQFDPLHAQVPRWADASCYLCSVCIVVQTLLAVGATFADFRLQQGGGAQLPKVRAKVIEVLNLVLMTFLYGAVIFVIAAVYRIGSGSNLPRAYPLSLHCIIGLSVLYFAVYWAHLTLPLAQRSGLMQPSFRVGELSRWEMFVGVFGKEAAGFCPKFCILFLSSLMRASLLTGGRGAPQAWCQAAQCLAAVCIFLLAVVRVDVMTQEPGGKLATICTRVQLVCMSVLYLSAILIVIALFTLTPENARGPGALETRA